MCNILFLPRKNIELVVGSGNMLFPAQSHKSMLLGVITEGRAALTIGSKTQELSSNMCYLIPSGAETIMKPITSYKYLTVCLKPPFNKMPIENDIICNPQTSNTLSELCEDFLKMKDENSFADTVRKLFWPGQSFDNVEENRTILDFVGKAVEYIEEHIFDDIEVDDIAKSVFVSKFHLCRCFKIEMNVTIKHYILQEKIRRLKIELISEKSLASLAAKYGFSSQSHMGSVFRHFMGITATNYRNGIVL